MGKNLIQQRRGKGTLTYRSPSFRFTAATAFRTYDETERTSCVNGKIVDLLHCPGHSAPLMKIMFNKDVIITIAPEGVKVGDIVSSGIESSINTGNTLPLKCIPEGSLIFNLESQPGDGGKFVKGSGTFARVLSKQKDKVTVMLPSKAKKEFIPECRATIGIIAGGGRTEKPLVKAGNNYHKMKARNKLYPRTSAVAMNAVCHPFGGSRTSKKNGPTIAPRFAPPGAKVGKIRPRRTGKRK